MGLKDTVAHLDDILLKSMHAGRLGDICRDGIQVTGAVDLGSAALGVFSLEQLDDPLNHRATS
jgi:hypothetical protein